MDFDLAKSLWGDPLVTRMIDSSGPLSDQRVLARLEAEIAHERKQGVQYWPIFLRNGLQFVGCCGVRPYQPADHVFELGFHIRPLYWRQGIAEEAARAVIRHAFESIQAKALFAGHHPENVGSRRLLEKLRFRHTGTVFYSPTGLDHDSYLLSREIWSAGNEP